LGEIRSSLSESVKVMALTATATKGSCEEICSVLGMSRPFVVSKSPNKQNIKYSVVLKSVSMVEAFTPLVEEVR
jgi:ATP-dependent DNA helicase RecQ